MKKFSEHDIIPLSVDISGQYERYKRSEHTFTFNYEYSEILQRMLILNIGACIILKYSLKTYFLSVAIFNEFILNNPKTLKTLKELKKIDGLDSYLTLISITSVFTASKIEEVYPEKTRVYLSTILPYGYGKKDIEQTEHKILDHFKWNLHTISTSCYFLHYYAHTVTCEGKVVDLAEYILILLSIDINSLKYKPSLLALCSLLVACERISPSSIEISIGPLIDFTGYNIKEIEDCKKYILTYVKPLKDIVTHELLKRFRHDILSRTYSTIKDYI